MRPAFILILFATAVLIRIGFTYGYRGTLELVPVHAIAGADSVEYDQLARSLVAGNGYAWPDGKLTSFRAPGFPLSLAVLYTLTGSSYLAAYLFFACCGGLTAISTYLLGRELFDERKARIAGLVAAIYPGDVYACSFFFSEVVFAPCLGFGLWLLARHVRTGSLWLVGLAGLFLGYAALTRSFGILFLPVFSLYLFGLPPTRRGFVSAIVYGLAFLMVIAPWTYRNAVVHHQLVLIATNGGSTFYGANNDIAAGSLRQHGNWISTTELPGRDQIDAQPDEVSHDKMEWKLGTEWVKQHPAKFSILCVFKAVRFWLPFVQWPSLKTYPVVNIATTSPFLILILIGLLTSLVRRADQRTYAVLHLTMAANLVMVVIFWGDPRFRDANVPVLAIYTVMGLAKLFPRRFSNTESPTKKS